MNESPALFVPPPHSAAFAYSLSKLRGWLRREMRGNGAWQRNWYNSNQRGFAGSCGIGPGGWGKRAERGRGMDI